jgi:hypothetical protein
MVGDRRDVALATQTHNLPFRAAKFICHSLERWQRLIQRQTEFPDDLRKSGFRQVICWFKNSGYLGPVSTMFKENGNAYYHP